MLLFLVKNGRKASQKSGLYMIRQLTPKRAQNKPQSRKQTTASTCIRPLGTLPGTRMNQNRLIPSPEPLTSPKTSPKTNLLRRKKILGDTLPDTPEPLSSPRKNLRRAPRNLTLESFPTPGGPLEIRTPTLRGERIPRRREPSRHQCRPFCSPPLPDAS